MTQPTRRLALRTAALALVATCGAALAQTPTASGTGPWPNRPIRIVIPYAAGSSPDVFARIVAEKQRVGQYGDWALLSALTDDLAPVFSGITQPTFLLAPHDGLEDETRAAAKLIKGSRVQELPSLAYGLFDAAPVEIAGHMLRFLGR